ncbi:hypothetical protein Ahy_B03g063240 isoform E [Arachis hypogaea]|uniref:Uncharacterized protein n=1 Tax=Arachis hypogaea TaxID=3818 RepID=A0A444ZWN0_ARAHY|nr:hypothetical protein Ahy_B03g063240 isoform E [Arachis hypogaea]
MEYKKDHEALESALTKRSYDPIQQLKFDSDLNLKSPSPCNNYRDLTSKGKSSSKPVPTYSKN